MKQAFEVRDLGLMDYQEAWQLQLDTHAAVVQGHSPATLLLVEHPPVITFGKKGGRDNLLVQESFLKDKGFSLYDIERGGDVTYHGPGQLVGYPIFKIGRKVQVYLRGLEEVMMRVLTHYGIESVGSPGYAGVWVDEEKLVSIGVAIKQDVSYHGFAMNVATNLAHFNYIVPCGLVGKRMTSLSKVLDRDMSLDEVKALVIREMRAVFSEAALAAD